MSHLTSIWVRYFRESFESGSNDNDDDSDDDDVIVVAKGGCAAVKNSSKDDRVHSLPFILANHDDDE